jgi:hypothetical protein
MPGRWAEGWRLVAHGGDRGGRPPAHPFIARQCDKGQRENARWLYTGHLSRRRGFYSVPSPLPLSCWSCCWLPRWCFASCSLLLNPNHEIFGFLVVFGSAVSIAGACTVPSTAI